MNCSPTSQIDNIGEEEIVCNLRVLPRKPLSNVPSLVHPTSAFRFLHDNLLSMPLTWPLIYTSHTIHEFPKIPQLTCYHSSVEKISCSLAYKTSFLDTKGFLWWSLHISLALTPKPVCLHSYVMIQSYSIIFHFPNKLLHMLIILPASWETCMQVRKQQLELDMDQQTGSKYEKEYVKAVYCHPAYLTYMPSTSWETWAGRSTSWNQDCWEKSQ